MYTKYMYSYSKDFFYKKGSLGGGFSVQSILRTTDNSSSLQPHSDTQLGGKTTTTTRTSEEKEEIDRLKNLVVPFGLVHSAIKKNGKGIEREIEFGEEEREEDYLNERVHTLLLAMADEKIKNVKSKKNSSAAQTKKKKRYNSRKMSRRVGK
jgi:hypothetical protein